MNDLTEIVSNRQNPGIDPQLHIWGWEIPVYLFLGGLVAGLLVLGGYWITRGALASRSQSAPRAETRRAWPYAPMLGIVLLSVGMLALFLDLGHKLHAWRMYLTFQLGSPMSWGAWILVLVYPALLAAAVLHPPERVPFGESLLRRAREWSVELNTRPRLVMAVGVANITGGLALGLYTGILLGSLGARPLWNSALLGPLFLISGLSTAAALMHILSVVAERRAARGKTIDSLRASRTGFADALLAGLFRLFDPRAGGDAMLRADTSFVTLELVLLALWLLGLVTTTAVHAEAATLVLSGDYAPAFWALVVVTGLIAPLILQAAELSGRIKHTLAPAVMVLVGGFALRWILVSAGQASHW